jgi:hypothetical protein
MDWTWPFNVGTGGEFSGMPPIADRINTVHPIKNLLRCIRRNSKQN